MRFVMILPDGAADEAVDSLGGRTPLQAARTPHMDWIAAHGRCGTALTVPAGFTPASDVATLSVIGYDPTRYYTGRAPLEAAARNCPVGPADVVFRCNLTTIVDHTMFDFSAGHISQSEAEVLIADINQAFGGDDLRFYPGVMYRHLMVLRDPGPLDVTCTAPHDIPGEPIEPHLPRGADAARVIRLMEQARPLLEDHAVNQARRTAGQPAANAIWLWGHGRPPALPSFAERFGRRGACIAAVDLIRGIGKLIGWTIHDVAGATGYLDTDYAAKGRAAVALLKDYDLVCVHIEAPDEAGHNGDAAAKVVALEQIDQHIVGPLLDALRAYDCWRILVIPDHPTPVGLRTHTRTPPPFCMAGTGLAAGAARTFDEASCAGSGVHCNPAHQLMESFLTLQP